MTANMRVDWLCGADKKNSRRQMMRSAVVVSVGIFFALVLG